MCVCVFVQHKVLAVSRSLCELPSAALHTHENVAVVVRHRIYRSSPIGRQLHIAYAHVCSLFQHMAYAVNVALHVSIV